MGQPPLKKMKLSEKDDVNANSNGLIDEAQFIADNGGVGKEVVVRIKVPKDEKKKQFKFNGQTLTFTMRLNQSIQELKQRIFNVLTIPINKQKLKIQSNGVWVKGDGSLAFYNVNSNA